MKKLLRLIVRKIVRLEHHIYCLTNTKIELPLHKGYYKYEKLEYEKYRKSHQVIFPKYDW